jgi:hypothetical protein
MNFYRLVEQAQKTKFFWIDDAWVTGMLGNVNKYGNNNCTLPNKVFFN